MSASTPALFTPLQVGAVTVQHRIVLAPMTRFRANTKHEHGALGIEYYSQRASTPGTLLITEGTFIAPQAGGYPTAPGIWADEQIAAWKKITDAVHAKGSFIFLQLWALGRISDPAVLAAEGLPFVSASAVPLAGSPAPRPLTQAEIAEYVQLYAVAARNAVARAGFDGVEIHGANGYLVDQFLQTNTNERTDAYGGSLEGRLRFALEVTAAVVGAVGADRTGLRLSPWSRFNEMRMADPLPTFLALIERLKTVHPDLAYLHLVEPRIVGNNDDPVGDAPIVSSKVFRDAWAPRPFIATGGFGRESALAAVEKEGGLVAFGRHFIANPDLPSRLKSGIELAPYHRDTFYTPGPVGYTDYAFVETWY